MEIKARNFMSWESLEFKVGQGVTLIQGFNHDDGTQEGSGKSAILNALCWGLFGAIPKDANVDEVIREGKTNCQVEIIHPEFTVFRSRGPNDLYIKKGSKTIRGKDARETQKEIEKLVGMTFHTFCQSIYFAQNYPNKFVTANQESKGKILSEILDLEQFDRARKITADKIKAETNELVMSKKLLETAETGVESQQRLIDDFKQLIDKFQEDKIKTIKAQLSELEALEEESKSYVKEFEKGKKESIKEAQTQVEEVQTKLDENRKAIDELEELNISSQFEDLKSKAANILAIIEKKDESRNELKVKLGNIENILQGHEKQKRDSDNAYKEIASINQRIKNKQLDLEGADSDLVDASERVKKAVKLMNNPSKDKKCPTCGQDWKGDVAHFEKEVASAQNAEKKADRVLETYKKDLAALYEQKENLNTVVQLLGKEISSFEAPTTDKLEKQIDAKSDEIKALKDDRLKIEGTLRNLQHLDMQKDSLKKERLSLVKEFKAAELELAELQSMSPEHELSRFQKRIDALTASIEAEDAKEPELLKTKLKSGKENLKLAKKAAEDLKASVDELQDRIVMLETLREGYKEVKAYTFENILNQLTRKTNKYLAELFSQSVKMKFQNVDMKIDATVRIDGHDRPLGLYSGGQFRRIALAVDLALADITLSRKSNKFNLIILDEYFKDLSEISMERVLKVLQARRTPTLLIEHNSVFKSIVNQTFECELRNKVSREI